MQQMITKMCIRKSCIQFTFSLAPVVAWKIQSKELCPFREPAGIPEAQVRAFSTLRVPACFPELTRVSSMFTNGMYLSCANREAMSLVLLSECVMVVQLKRSLGPVSSLWWISISNSARFKFDMMAFIITGHHVAGIKAPLGHGQWLGIDPPSFRMTGKIHLHPGSKWRGQEV